LSQSWMNPFALKLLIPLRLCNMLDMNVVWLYVDDSLSVSIESENITWLCWLLLRWFLQSYVLRHVRTYRRMESRQIFMVRQTLKIYQVTTLLTSRPPGGVEIFCSEQRNIKLGKNSTIVFRCPLDFLQSITLATKLCVLGELQSI
jgi:hypothetical protein